MYQQFTLVTVRPTGSYGSLPCPASRERIGPHLVSLEKDQNSKSESQFRPNTFHFYTIIKSKKSEVEQSQEPSACAENRLPGALVM